ncbi:tetratricopeptide repeat protein [Halosquirtibacter xylanolyticus]|uniref:tetratricopeptide repeat protein n=1 Tax=Halosquirtibacter xylanolyticus TaxID=3374599 RepID=UPI00374A5384|nr:tetratricopeptide repeat protein [Prolixibacteraceae bacterium]
MKAIFKRTLMLMIAISLSSVAALAQKKITGVVYKEGKPAAGVEVSAHKSKDSFFTSFDGKYELTISSKSKYIRFAFPDKEEKLDIEGKEGNVFNYNYGGKPFEAPKAAVGGVNLGSHSELAKAKNADYTRNYSLFSDFYKQKDYKSALKPWKILYTKYPKSSVNIYIKGVKMYDAFINLASTKSEIDELMNKELEIYDQRAKYFGKKGYIEGRKAISYLQHMYNKENMTDDQLKVVCKKGYTMLDASIKEQGNKSQAAVILLYMQVSGDLYRIGELSKEQMIKNYDTTSAIIDANDETESDSFNTIKSSIDKMVVRSGALDCESIVAIYEPKIKANPDDIAMLRKMMRLFRRQDCTDSDLFNEGAERLYSLEPSAGSAISMAQRYMRNQEADKAIEYLNKALEMNKTEKNIANDFSANYYLGALYYQKSSFGKALKYTKLAIKADPEEGKAYILAGNILAVGSKTYGKSSFEHSMVFWLAYDYFAKAKRVDPSVAAEAQKKMSTYKKYFPEKNELFFQGYKSGQTIQLGGWINESTKARNK